MLQYMPEGLAEIIAPATQIPGMFTGITFQKEGWCTVLINVPLKKKLTKKQLREIAEIEKAMQLYPDAKDTIITM